MDLHIFQNVGNNFIAGDVILRIDIEDANSPYNKIEETRTFQDENNESVEENVEHETQELVQEKIDDEINQIDIPSTEQLNSSEGNVSLSQSRDSTQDDLLGTHEIENKNENQETDKKKFNLGYMACVSFDGIIDKPGTSHVNAASSTQDQLEHDEVDRTEQKQLHMLATNYPVPTIAADSNEESFERKFEKIVNQVSRVAVQILPFTFKMDHSATSCTESNQANPDLTYAGYRTHDNPQGELVMDAASEVNANQDQLHDMDNALSISRQFEPIAVTPFPTPPGDNNQLVSYGRTELEKQSVDQACRITLTKLLSFMNQMDLSPSSKCKYHKANFANSNLQESNTSHPSFTTEQSELNRVNTTSIYSRDSHQNDLQRELKEKILDEICHVAIQLFLIEHFTNYCPTSKLKNTITEEDRSDSIDLDDNKLFDFQGAFEAELELDSDSIDLGENKSFDFQGGFEAEVELDSVASQELFHILSCPSESIYEQPDPVEANPDLKSEQNRTHDNLQLQIIDNNEANELGDQIRLEMIHIDTCSSSISEPNAENLTPVVHSVNDNEKNLRRASEERIIVMIDNQIDSTSTQLHTNTHQISLPSTSKHTGDGNQDNFEKKDNTKMNQVIDEEQLLFASEHTGDGDQGNIQVGLEKEDKTNQVIDKERLSLQIDNSFPSLNEGPKQQQQEITEQEMFQTEHDKDEKNHREEPKDLGILFTDLIHLTHTEHKTDLDESDESGGSDSVNSLEMIFLSDDDTSDDRFKNDFELFKISPLSKDNEDSVTGIDTKIGNENLDSISNSSSEVGACCIGYNSNNVRVESNLNRGSCEQLSLEEIEKAILDIELACSFKEAQERVPEPSAVSEEFTNENNHFFDQNITDNFEYHYNEMASILTSKLTDHVTEFHKQFEAPDSLANELKKYRTEGDLRSENKNNNDNSGPVDLELDLEKIISEQPDLSAPGPSR